MDTTFPFLTPVNRHEKKKIYNFCPCTESLLIKFHCSMNCCATVLDNLKVLAPNCCSLHQKSSLGSELLNSEHADFMHIFLDSM